MCFGTDLLANVKFIYNNTQCELLFVSLIEY